MLGSALVRMSAGQSRCCYKFLTSPAFAGGHLSLRLQNVQAKMSMTLGCVKSSSSTGLVNQLNRQRLHLMDAQIILCLQEVSAAVLCGVAAAVPAAGRVRRERGEPGPGLPRHCLQQLIIAAGTQTGGGC